MVEIGDKIADLNIKVGTVVGICPLCSNELVVKTGKYGKFVGCNGFKSIGCRKTYRYETFRIFDDDVIAALNNKLRIFNEIFNIKYSAKQPIFSAHQYEDDGVNGMLKHRYLFGLNTMCSYAVKSTINKGCVF